MDSKIKWIIALAAFAMTAGAANAECGLRPLAPVGSTARADGRTIQLGEADDATHPAAWQGPLVADVCTLDLGIIEEPLVMTKAGMLYVPTYSGSVRRLLLVDLQACKVRWQSAAFVGELNISPRALRLGVRRVLLNARCVPRR